MINFLSSWVKNLCLALIVVSILEMLLPNNKTKKYVKVVMGLYIMFSIIAPFGENRDELKFDVENLYSQYSVETSESVNQNSMDKRLDEIYEQRLKDDVTQKLEEEGYTVDECSVNAHVSSEDSGIELLKIKVQSEDNLKETDIKKIEKFLMSEYGVSEKCLKIN